MNRLEKILSLHTIFILLIMVGMTCNTLIYKNNGGRMPVYMGYIDGGDIGLISFETPRHFGFWDKSEVEYHYLADIIKVPFDDKIVSIGDIIMYIFGLAFLINSLFLIKELNKRRNIDKGRLPSE